MLYLGGVIVTNTRYYTFQGQIDEVRVWNVARTPGDLQANMSHELTGNEAGLAAYYRMSDGSGLTLTDNSGHGWNGTLMDGAGILPPDGSPPQWVISQAF